MGNESRGRDNNQSSGMSTRSRGSNLKRQRSSEEEAPAKTTDQDKEDRLEEKNIKQSDKSEDTKSKKRVRLNSSNQDAKSEISEPKEKDADQESKVKESNSSFIVGDPFKHCYCPKNVMKCIGILPAAPFVMSMGDSDSEDDDYIISGIIPQVERKSGSHD